MMHWDPDEASLLGSSASANVTKILLDHAASLLSLASGLDVYRAYLKENLNVYMTNSNLAAISSTQLGLFYGEEALERPSFIDLSKQGHEVRLERLLGRRIVMLTPGKKEWIVLHDKRGYDLLSSSSDSRPPPHFIVFTFDKKETKVYAANEDSLHFSPLRCCGLWIRSSTRVEGCYLASLLHLLGLGRNETIQCPTLLDLIVKREAIKSILGHRSVTLKVMVRQDRRRLNARPTFETLLKYKGDGADTHDDVCVTSDGLRMYTVKREYLAPYRRDPSNELKREKLPNLPYRRDAKSPSPQPKMTARWRRARAAEAEWKAKLDCAGCHEGYQLRDNMSLVGPPKLYKTKLSSFDFLKIFGLDDACNIRLVRLAADSSLAAMDIESATILRAAPEGASAPAGHLDGGGLSED